MNNTQFGWVWSYLSACVAMGSVALMAGCSYCGVYGCDDSESHAVPPGQNDPPVATAKRFPVVTLAANGSRAAIVSNARENDDPQRPVQKVGSSFTFVPPNLAAPMALAGATGQNFIASGRPDLSGRNDSLVMDVSGNATAVWGASNAGTLELYANQYSAINGAWGPRQLLATLGSGGLHSHRIAMDGFGRVLVAWSEGDGLIRTQAFLPGQGWLTPTSLPAQFVALRDLSYRRNQGHLLFTDQSGAVFVATLDNYIWGAPVRIGSDAFDTLGQPRLASHRDAPDGSLVAVWRRSEGIYFNRLTLTGPEFADGQMIPGSEAGSDPQVVMGANEETTVVWSDTGGFTIANRAVGHVWGAAQQIDGGRSSRLAGDSAGNAVVVFGGTEVYATRFLRGSGWQPRELIGGDMVRQGVADVAMDDNGRAIAVWEQEVTDTPDPLDTRIAVAVIGTPTARFSASPNPAVAGMEVVFDASASSDPAGSIDFYEWDYTDDGRPDARTTTPVLRHVFSQPGTYRVKLWVTGSSGLVSAEASQNVTIGAVSTYGINLVQNPGFEDPVALGTLPTSSGYWQGDVAVSVGTDRGIAPHGASRMLRFDATGNVASTNTLASQQWQIIDVSSYRADIDAGMVRADASAWFNRVIGDASTDRRFDIRVLAFNVAAADLPAAYVANAQLAVQASSILTAGDLWQPAALSMPVPAGTRLLLVEIYAFEDVVNEAVGPELAGHYADDVSLVLLPN